MLLVDLAASSVANEPVSLKSIAERLGLSEHYLEQLIAPLRNAGLVRSVRGARGGYTLARNGAEITAFEALIVLEGPLEIVGGDIDDGFGEFWRTVEFAIAKELQSITLKDLLNMRELHSENYMYYI